MKEMTLISKMYVSRIQKALRLLRQDDRLSLYFTDKDRIRLLTLRVWEKKYKIDTLTMLHILIPFWDRFMNKRVKRISKSLGVRVATLTGKKSEQILVDTLHQTFPNQENVALWMSSQREQIISDELKRVKKSDKFGPRVDPSSMEDDETGKILGLTDFSSPAKYLRYYRKWIRKEQAQRDRIQNEMRKYPYRNNPFLEETL